MYNKYFIIKNYSIYIYLTLNNTTFILHIFNLQVSCALGLFSFLVDMFEYSFGMYSCRFSSLIRLRASSYRFRSALDQNSNSNICWDKTTYTFNILYI